MGLFDWFKKQQPSSQPSAPSPSPLVPPANPGTTRIEREHFLLHAPFEWKAVPPTKELEYELWNETLPEQLIVTVLLAHGPMDAADRRSVVQELTNTRLGVIAELSGGQAQHSAPQQNEGEGECEVRCYGVAEPNGVRFAFVVRAASGHVVTVALTRYLLDDVGVSFEAYCGLIFDYLRLKDGSQPADG